MSTTIGRSVGSPPYSTRNRCDLALGISFQEYVAALQELAGRAYSLAQQSTRIAAQVQDDASQPLLLDVAQCILEIVGKALAKADDAHVRYLRIWHTLPSHILQSDVCPDQCDVPCLAGLEGQDGEGD
jgi:hypothetical protein